MMRLAIFQMLAKCGDVAANLDRIENAACEAARSGATLLVTPELALTGYGAGEQIVALAEPATGPSIAQLGEIAGQAGIAILAGFAERDETTIFNSAAYIDGRLPPVVYRKSHLYGDYERGLFQPAVPRAVTFDHGGVRCGMLICYDVEFPENVRRLARANADVVLAPTALPMGASASFIVDHMIQTRAFENQLFIAYVNHCGADDLFRYAGRSCVAGPDGQLLATANGADAAVLVVDIDPASFDQSRAENTYLEDLRTG